MNSPLLISVQAVLDKGVLTVLIGSCWNFFTIYYSLAVMNESRGIRETGSTEW